MKVKISMDGISQFLKPSVVFFLLVCAVLSTRESRAALPPRQESLFKPVENPRSQPSFSLVGRTHLDFNKEVSRVLSWLRNPSLDKETRYSLLQSFRNEHMSILLEKQKNVNSIEQFLLVKTGPVNLATEQSAQELQRRQVKVGELLCELSRKIHLGFHRKFNGELCEGPEGSDVSLRKSSVLIRELYLLIAGEEFYLKNFSSEKSRLQIVSSEGSAKNNRPLKDPQGYYRQISTHFRKQIRKISKDARAAERIFSWFTENYHLCVRSWEVSVRSRARSLPHQERDLLVESLLKLQTFFQWNHLRDLEMVHRFRTLEEDTILFSGHGHLASLNHKRARLKQPQ